MELNDTIRSQNAQIEQLKGTQAKNYSKMKERIGMLSEIITIINDQKAYPQDQRQ